MGDKADCGCHKPSIDRVHYKFYLVFVLDQATLPNSNLQVLSYL